MQKTIKTAGYALLTVVVLLIAGMAIIAAIAHTLDRDSKVFVDSAIPAIVSDWDITELQKRASPEFEETVDYDDLSQYFEMLQELGNMTEYKGSRGEARIALSFLNRIVVTALYTAKADFDEGSADIRISLIKHDGKWQILGFQVTPRELEQRHDII